MKAFVYDIGMLIAAEKGQVSAMEFHRRLLERNVVPIVPVAVLVEAWRGSSPRLAKFLKGTQVRSLSEDQAKAAGQLLAKSSRRAKTSVTDATVVLTALTEGAAIATADQKDLTALIDGNNLKINLALI